MQNNDEMVNLNKAAARANANVSGWLGKVLTVVMGAVLLVVGLMFSLLVFVVAAAAAVLIIGFLWWKTRGQHRQMREPPVVGRIIDGEAVREKRKF